MQNKTNEQSASRYTFTYLPPVSVACVAGGISRASAFVFVANTSGGAARELVKSSRIPPATQATVSDKRI